MITDQISELSVVSSDAKLADNVTVEPFTTIAGDVEIGEGTWIGPNATIMAGARIGKNCKIFPGAVIAAIPQDLKYAGEYSTVEIGDNVIIRECATINRGTEYSGTTKIGNNVLIMAYVHVAHDCIIGNNVVLANAVNIGGHVEIDDHVIIGGMSAIHQFCKIGAHAFLSGGSGLNKDVPPYVKGARVPVSYVGVNSVGLRRRGFTNDQVHNIQDIYRKIFVEDYNISQALDWINNEIPDSEERTEILSFIARSTRGIIKGY